MTTGEKIAALRREHKLSQEALGEKLGLSRQAVSKWEADQAVPTMDNLMELSRLFGVPVDTLLRPDAPFPAAPAEDGAGKESEDAPAAPETPSALRQPRRNKAVLIGGAALLCVSLACSAVCAWSTIRLRAEVDGLRSLVNGLSLNSTVYYPQTDTNDDFAESSESVAIDPNDPEKLLVTFSAIPREISDGETAKFLIHSDGQSWECEPATTNPYSGSLTIPLVDDYSVYLALTGADGGTRNLFVASESSLKDRFRLFVTAAWQDGRRTANYAGYIETMVYCGGDDVKPVSGRVVLEKDGRQVKEQEIDVKGSLSSDGYDDAVEYFGDAVFYTQINWRDLDGTLDYDLKVEITDNYGRVFTADVV